MKVYTFSITVQDRGILRQVPFAVKANKLSQASLSTMVAILGSNASPQNQREGYILGPSRLVAIKVLDALGLSIV